MVCVKITVISGGVGGARFLRGLRTHVERALPEAERLRLEARIGRISALYDDMSGAYLASKAENDIPLN